MESQQLYRPDILICSQKNIKMSFSLYDSPGVFKPLTAKRMFPIPKWNHCLAPVNLHIN